MLVLSRSPGEEVVVGDYIRLTVVAIRGSRVLLGITAPAELSILRSELSPRVDDSDEPGPRPGDLPSGIAWLS